MDDGHVVELILVEPPDDDVTGVAGHGQAVDLGPVALSNLMATLRPMTVWSAA